eukprot:RCo006325
MPPSSETTESYAPSFHPARRPRAVTVRAEPDPLQGGLGSFRDTSRLKCHCCCNPSSIPCRRQRRSPRHCHLPIWALLVSLSTLSLVVVGMLAFELTALGSENAINFVGVKYRQLACTSMESQVVDFLTSLVESTRHLAMYAAASPVGQADPTPEELRKFLLTRMMTTSEFSH